MRKPILAVIALTGILLTSCSSSTDYGSSPTDLDGDHSTQVQPTPTSDSEKIRELIEQKLEEANKQTITPDDVLEEIGVSSMVEDWEMTEDDSIGDSTFYKYIAVSSDPEMMSNTISHAWEQLNIMNEEGAGFTLRDRMHGKNGFLMYEATGPKYSLALSYSPSFEFGGETSEPSAYILIMI